mmetsp:Transcript_80655/g.204997  ORF Transcript_80655/g.204997 Transcript_80655/m.204997 type:complete len:239 (-) Transcript_80655:25-741(-)
MSKLSCITSKPGLPLLDWWLRTMRLRPFLAQKTFVTSQPNCFATFPRGEACTPNTFASPSWLSSSMGSDHRMELIQSLSSLLRSSCLSGLLTFISSASPHRASPRPPCTTNIFSPTRQPKGSTSNTFCIKLRILNPKSWPNELKHSAAKPYLEFMLFSSWLPLTRKILSGMDTLSAKRRPTNANWCFPLSTKSPLNTKHTSLSAAGAPKAWNNMSTSRNCPCVSPNILHGTEAFTRTG